MIANAVTLGYASKGGVSLDVTELTHYEMMLAMDVMYKIKQDESKKK